LQLIDGNSLIKNYSKLEETGCDRVVISFTTTPERLSKIKPMILSLLDQTLKVDEIALSIPYGKYEIPEYLKDVVTIYYYSIDYGTAGNLVPCVLREREGDTKIILVADNVIYGKDFIERIIEESENSPRKCVSINDLSCKNGILITPDFFDQSFSSNNDCKNCIQWLRTKLTTGIINVKYSENYKY